MVKPLLAPERYIKEDVNAFDAALVDAYPVSSEVNSPKNNHIGLLNSL